MLVESLAKCAFDKEEIKLEMFAYDATAFLRNIRSLEILLHTADLVSKCSGLEINFEETYTFCCSFTQNIQSFTSTVETITQIYIH